MHRPRNNIEDKKMNKKAGLTCSNQSFGAYNLRLEVEVNHFLNISFKPKRFQLSLPV